MKRFHSMKAASLLGLALITSGCENINSQLATAAAMDGLKAAMITDGELRSVSQQAAAEMDSKNSVAPASSKYAQRLNRLMGPHTQVNGISINYAVYLDDTVNAFAMADGTVRVYSGLMDILTDDELRFVIGHEIGHVFHEHSKNQMRLALSTSALRKGTASIGGTLGSIAASDIGALSEKVVNAQFSQAEEKEADDYGFNFLKGNGYDAKAAETALRKLGNSGGGLLSSHPNPQDRADRVSRHSH